MNRYKKGNIRNNDGFTLVEMMVVLVIMGILLAIASGGLIAYLRTANFKKNNEYAKTIYTAAQTSFTYAKDSGTLEDLADEIKTEVNDDSHSSNVGIFSANMLSGDTENGGIDLNKLGMTESSGYYYCIFNKGDTLTGARKKVYDMIAPYIYDAEILDADFSIEFDAVDGKVIGVCYDDRSDGFKYSMGPGTFNGNTDISYRGLSKRAEILLGYYGADSLSARTPERDDKLIINSLKLVNGKSLELKWKMNDRSSYLSSTYTVNLYDETNSNQLKATITLTGVTKNTTKPQECQVVKYTYNQNGVATPTESQMNFRVYADNSTYIHLVLDAADLGADIAMNKGESYDDTYSIQRLGFEPCQMYATLQATGTGYKMSDSKESNKENSFFANQTLEGTASTYEISNARHLYNVRFVERSTESNAASVTYQQTANVDWDDKTTGLVQSGNVYASQTIQNQAGTQFPTMDQLRAGHTYESSANSQIYSIQGLRLINHNNLKQTDGSRSHISKDTPGLGLFGINSGTIQRINFKNCSAGNDKSVYTDDNTTSDTYVGIAAGINNGILNQVSTDSDCVVQGQDYVGGIVGCDVSAYDFNASDKTGLIDADKLGTRSYSGLQNAARVYGHSFIGGVTGYLKGTSENDAKVSGGINGGINEGYITGTGFCIGGIVGYNEKVSITNCSSNPVRPANWVEPTTDGEVQALLTGTYVGGIVGLNNKAKIYTCSNGSSGSTSYVVGGDYVGGIVGLQIGASPLDGSGKQNYAYVLGKNYVGGIVGASGKINNVDNIVSDMLVGKEAKIIKSSQELGIIVSNWENKGVVTAYGEYAGGIVGFNGGTIINSSTYMDTNGEEEKEQVVAAYAKGDYIGGIAGYNIGDIGVSDENEGLKVNSVVTGNNHLGGMVGYEASEATLSGYNLSGGYINGTGHSIGGVVGTNQSEDLLSQAFSAKPSSVTGASKVGGYIGTNEVKLSENKTINNFVANNSLATISAGGQYAGGIIGYNETTGGTLTIGNSNAQKSVEFNQISANEDAGGVVGGASDGSDMLLQNITNETKVSATTSKDSKHAGGVIGKNTRNITIDNCKNSSAARISSNGFYHGALAEVNDGTIENCQANTFGSANSDNVGGITGQNKGTVKDCYVDGVIIGNDNVGGLVATNEYGATVEKTSTETRETVCKNIKGSGDYIGGVAGTNKGTIQGVTLASSVSNTGTYVGGIVGNNEGNGTLTDCSTGTYTIKGSSFVGGLAGTDSANMTGLENNSNVVATTDGAGGIAGKTSGTVTVSECTNNGKITLEKTGMAGGITSTVGSGVQINACTNTGDVTATASNAGGVAGINEGTITGGTITGKITAKEHLGGVVADNNGTISEVTIGQGLTFAASTASSTEFLEGAITGKNHENAIVSNCTVGTEGTKVSMETSKDGGSYGGAAGLNEGSITGTTVNANIVPREGTNISANMGGIAGENKKSITNSTFSGTINGYKGASYGYGGIAGLNSGTITNSGLLGGSVKAVGDADDIVRVGGISGQNKASGELQYCYVNGGIIEADSSTAVKGVGYVGGYAGYNEGTINGCGYENHSTTNRTSDDQEVKVMVYNGHLGGMIGYNDKTGVLTNSVNGGSESSHTTSTGRWRVEATYHATDNGTGGAIGYNASSTEIKNVSNFADVTKTQGASTVNAIAGIIGRQETQSGSGFGLTNCKNYGNVQGSESNGGMIGRWKYRGGQLYQCENYGTISGKSASGGMIGDLYQVSADESIRLNGCVNEGTISNSGNMTGGMVGNVSINTASGIKLNIYNCVNKGVIAAPGSNTAYAGILANHSGSSVSVTIERCRNYGIGSGSNASKFAGIFGSGGSNKVTLKDNFGVANIEYPITSSTVTMSGNYYFGTKTSVDDPNTINQPEYNAMYNGSACKVASSDPLSNMFDNKGATRMSLDLGSNVTPTTGKPVELNITLATPKSISSMTTTWYNKDRTYNYDIILKDSEGNEIGGIDGCSTKGEVSHKDTFDGVENVKYVTIKVTASKNPTNNSQYVSIYDIHFDEYVWKTVTASSSDVKGTMMYVTQQESTWKGTSEFSEGIYVEDMSYDPRNCKTSADTKDCFDGVDSHLKVFYKNNEELSAPTTATLTATMGAYNLEWDAVEFASGYEVQIIPSLNGVEETDTSKYLTIVVSGNANNVSFDLPDSWKGQYDHIKGVVKATNDQGESAGTSSKELELAAFLPAPQVYYALQSNGQYKLRIRNASNYNQLSDADKEATQIIVGIGNSNSTYKLSDVINEDINLPDYKGVNSSTVVSAYAHDNRTTPEYQDSTKLSYETTILDQSILSGANTASANGYGFLGTGTSDMSYNLLLKPNGREIYYRSEFMVDDADFGQVSVSSSTVRVSTANATGINVGLRDLPDITKLKEKDVTVRSYPWSSQNNIAQYSYYVAEGVSKTDITGNTKWYDASTTKKMKAGYIVEKAEDGKYNVIYSALVGDQTTYPNQVLYPELHWPSGAKGSIVIADTDCKEGDNSQYTFSWTDEAAPDDSLYTVTLTGTMVDGSTVEIYNESNLTKDETKDGITLDGSAWRYINIDMVVTRQSVTDASGYITTFATSATHPFPQKLHLATVDGVDVEYADSSHDNLKYKVSWNANTEGCECYTVRIKDGATGKVEKRTGITDTNVTLDFENDNDISSFKNVEITVIAVAKESDTTYRNSLENDPYTLKVASRKAAPVDVANKLTLVPTIESHPFITQDAFTKTGFSLAFANDSIQEDGNYEVRVNIYKAKSDTPELVYTYKENTKDVVSMNGDLKSSSLKLTGIPWQDCAGYFMKVDIRSVNAGEINSTYESKWFRLPDTKLNTPAIEETLKDERYDMIGSETLKADVKQDTIKWSREDTKIASYLIDTAKLTDAADTFSNQYQLTMNDTNDTIELKHLHAKQNATTGEWEDEVRTTTPTTEQPADPSKELSYNKTMTYDYDLGITSPIRYTSGGVDDGITVKAHFIVTQVTSYERTEITDPFTKKDVTYDYEWVLPDVTDGESIGNLDGEVHMYTKGVKVTAQPVTADKDRILTSLYTLWQRHNDDDDWTTTITTEPEN